MRLHRHWATQWDHASDVIDLQKVLWAMEFGIWWFIRLADSRSDCANPLNCSITDCSFWRIWLCGGTRWCCFVYSICPNALPFISICSHLGLLTCVWKFHSQSSYSFQQNDMCDELLYMDSGLKEFRTQEAFNLTEIPIPFSSVCILYDSWLRKCWLDNSVVYWISSSNAWGTPKLQCYSLLLLLIFLVT